MSDPQQPTAVPASDPPPPQPQPDPSVTMHWPIEGTSITVGSVPLDNVRRKLSVVPVTFKIKLDPMLNLSEAVTLSLLYVVNGSLDYSALFSQLEISSHSTVTFPPGAEVVLRTLPLAPGATFVLEIVAYPASAEGVIAIPLVAETAEDKSLKALNVLATTALVTALAALAFALLRTRD
mgnify:CR=1 FL=1